jgi:hypothetical protein
MSSNAHADDVLPTAQPVYPAAQAEAKPAAPVYASTTMLNGRPWFLMKQVRSLKGDEIRYDNYFTSGDGATEYMKEEISTQPNGALKSYHYIQEQTGEDALFEINGNTLKYTVHNKKMKKEENGDDKLSDEKIARTVPPPLLLSFMSDHWAELKGSGRIDLWLLVPDRRESFKFFFAPLGKMTDTAPVTIRLKASNFFVALAAPAVDFVVDPRGSEKMIREVHNFPSPIMWPEKNGHYSHKNTDLRLTTSN